MCLLEARVIGVMRMLDGGEGDDKIIAVAANDMSVNHMNDISEMPSHMLKELRSFFEDYKKLENKEVVVEDFQGRELALEIINQAIVDYDAKFRQ
jgi:inorganic pyrophosphatase